MPSGYSGTPLIKKLGIKKDYKVRFIDAPADYLNLLGELPEGVEVLRDQAVQADFIHIFCKDIAHFEAKFKGLTQEIEKNGMIWVSWYKKASKIPTDMNENIIRDSALSMGLVDVKVCAVDEKWSGLKIVWRKENR